MVNRRLFTEIGIAITEALDLKGIILLRKGDFLTQYRIMVKELVGRTFVFHLRGASMEMFLICVIKCMEVILLAFDFICS